MGLQIGAVIIRQNIHEFKAEDIISQFFRNRYIELSEVRLAERKFDLRNVDDIVIYKIESFTVIANAKFTNNFYNEHHQKTIREVYRFFRDPIQIFAFENYDSGDTYSYSIINNGNLIRYFKFSNEKTLTFGKPLNIEVKLLHAKRIKENQDGDLYDYYIDPDTKEYHLESQMPQSLLRLVMNHEVGFFPENVDENAIEKRFFRILT